MLSARTSVIRMNVGAWSEKTSRSEPDMVQVAVEAAVFLGQHCGMDIMSMTHSPREDEWSYSLFVVYVNNGVSFAEVRRKLAPYTEDNPRKRSWMLQDFEESSAWILDCIVAINNGTESWE